MRTLTWNGHDLPAELRDWPPGRYVVTGADWDPNLTPEEEAGLVLAFEQLDRGELLTQEEVRTELKGRVKAARSKR
jgi:hypothetical protein